MTKFITAVAIVIVAALFPGAISATGEIHVSIEGQPIHFQGQGPMMIDGRTLVPIGDVFRELGFTVIWHTMEQRAFLVSDRYSIVLTIGADTFNFNGRDLPLEIPAQIINNATMLPLRAVVESIGYHLAWDANTRTVYISARPIPGRPFVYFSQLDPRWRDLPFGSFTIGRGGCGPTAMAMVVSTITGTEVLPSYVAEWGSRFYVSGIGSSHALFTHYASHRHFGLNFRTIPAYREWEVREALANGAVIVTSVQSRNSPNAREGAQGIFTINPEGEGGHIALVHGVTDNGNVLMASPRNGALMENTQGWPLSTLRREMHQGVGVFWVFE